MLAGCKVYAVSLKHPDILHAQFFGKSAAPVSMDTEPQAAGPHAHSAPDATCGFGERGGGEDWGVDSAEDRQRLWQMEADLKKREIALGARQRLLAVLRVG